MRFPFFGFSSLLLIGAVQSAPVYYSFTGVVTSTYASNGVAESSLTEVPIGTRVTYIFMLDREQSGYIDIWDNGAPLEHYVMEDYPNGDRSLGGYIGGSAISDIPDPYKVDYHFAEDIVSNGIAYGTIAGSNFDFSGHDAISVETEGRSTLTWAVGQNDFVGINQVFGEFEYIQVNSTLTLSSISETNPLEAPSSVPEPSSMVLFVVGCIALGVVTHRIPQSRGSKIQV
jgi:hypothetical protein